jgi:RING finger/CHY zinc finger protein 1
MYSDNENIKDKIKKIQSDINLTKEEKTKKIQELMMPKKKLYIKCSHYPHKKCSKFSFSCCNNSYDCVRCHNEVETHTPILDKIKCDACFTFQSRSNLCQNSDCNTFFSKNYCELCNLWTEADIYHCIECGLCRVGSKESLFHCKICDTCYNMDNSINHNCKSRELRNEICVFCLENVYNSQDSYFSINCGHFVHNNCLKKGVNMNQIRCPQCRKSIYDMDWSLLKMMISIQPMPQEDIIIGDTLQFIQFLGKVMIIVDDILTRDSIITYKCRFATMNDKIIYANRDSLYKAPKVVKIYCNDCNKKSETSFHYLGNECNLCNSYNTNII